MTDAEVETAYAKRAAEYTARFGSVESTHPADRKLVADWAAPLVGPVLDVGCGPGHWTKFLADHGAAVEGIDFVPAFIKQAQASFPSIPFRVASLTSLGVPEGYASGILAWYSLIHFEPDQVPSVLRELARRLTPGGLLLIGLFEGDEIARFPHAVTPAYSWPVGDLSGILSAAGFDTISHQRRTDPGHRPHAAISARLSRS
ncbi:class I SAM-dependent methyltransferase [Pseudarthrobacter sp. RMG13]|uniref:Class I SAM-dependent methyltransferase n=1 Tax=Pseudarthrobacter humi TaxID=2952523 RepID=A0ABT1LUI0_9MICC|nr:class I SAM-dependent methyltransferase [Pseudarthrobacter humi]MCP9002112.1 class I SAM-dependent methyltransferase [Pseudarthrobacter humi]